MPTLIPITVETENGNDNYGTPIVRNIDPNNIKLLFGEDGDLANDRAYVKYYDNQKKTNIDYICTEDADAIVTAGEAAGASFSDATYLNTLDNFDFNKLVYLNNFDSQIVKTANDEQPDRLVYNFGERNHARHKNLDVCDYPFVIQSFDSSSLNSVTIGCCASDLFAPETSITIAGTPNNNGTYTVVSSACSTDRTQTVIILEEALTNDLIGDPAGTVEVA